VFNCKVHVHLALYTNNCPHYATNNATENCWCHSLISATAHN